MLALQRKTCLGAKALHPGRCTLTVGLPLVDCLVSAKQWGLRCAKARQLCWPTELRRFSKPPLLHALNSNEQHLTSRGIALETGALRRGAAPTTSWLPQG